MDKKFIISVDIFNIDVEVYICDDVHDTLVKIDKENNDRNNRYEDQVTGFETAFSAYCNQFKDGMVYKRMILLITDDIGENELIHECLHTSWHVLDHVGVRVNPVDHEILAYLQGYIYGKVKNKLLKL